MKVYVSKAYWGTGRILALELEDEECGTVLGPYHEGR